MTAKRTKLLVGAVLAVLMVVWILQNNGPVQTKFLFLTVTMPQSALLAITLLAGVAGGILVTLSQTEKRQKKSE